MIDGLISLHTFDGEATYGGAFHGRDLEDEAPRLEAPVPIRSVRPDRLQAYARMAAALVEAGLVHRGAEKADHVPSIDIPALKAITECRNVSGRVGSLIREYLGSLAEIPVSVVPDASRPHGTHEVARWCLEIGRIPVGGNGLSYQ